MLPACPDDWRRVALAPPRAQSGPLAVGTLKATPEDFRVEERLSFEPSGDGPHWLLRVEKRGANTQWVASEIARRGRLDPRDIGFAGLKDRHAVAVQWFSVPRGTSVAEDWLGVSSEEFRVLDARANARKLKRGALSGNRFRIRLRGIAWPTELAAPGDPAALRGMAGPRGAAGPRETLEARLGVIRGDGVPSYFGPQRFGRRGANLDRVAEWVRSGAAPRGRAERGFSLSAARSLVFNALLGRRVAAGDWARLQPGDIASLDGSGSHFAVTAVDAETVRRARELDIHPSGPLWGRGEPRTQGAALAHELEIARELPEVTELLASQGLAQERRALRCAVRELEWSWQGDDLELSFSLARGQFATAVLRELCDLRELDAASLLDAGDD
ncbi:MAG TPA: tRNA pseudouridine(13) synthase TruD [Steroidobacteraceae bacterium]|nr:tRNA pseudouridine(13) synthase TruD [Steroidobacteraceae bacterium]